jgi:hypothetical protein
MAVDFSSRATDVTSTIEPETVVQNPVTREGEINALNQIGKGIGTAVRVARTAFDNQATLDANKRLAGFSLDLSRLQDAENQGLSTAEVMTRARRRLQQELANNPGAEEDILKRYSTWQSQSGYDKVSTPDIQKAQIEQAQVQTAVENGFLAADQINNPAAVDKAISDLENFQRTVRELEVSSKEIANKSAKLDLSGKEKANAKAEAEEVLTNGLAKVGQAALPYWRTQYENIKAAAAKAGSEQERQEIIKQGIIQLEQDFAQRTAAIAGDALNLPQAKIDQILAPQKALIDTYKKELSGEYDSEMFERQNKTIAARTKLQVWQGLTEEQRQWIVTSEMLGPAAETILQGKVGSIVVDMFTRNAAANNVTGGSPDERGQPTTKPADLTYADPTGKANAKTYLDGVTKAIEEVNSGKLDKYPDQKAALQQEVDAQLKGILKGVNVYGNSTESADQFQPLIDFFANPTVGAYLQQAGGIPAQIRGEVAKVFQDGYQTQVVPLLKDELGKMYSRNMKDVAPGGQLMVTVGDVVEPTMEGGRFGFKLKAGVPSDPVVNGIVRTMNNSTFSKVLNKMIISDAHIQGTNDYQKSFDTISPYLFGAEGEQEATTKEGLRPFKPGEEIDNGDGTISTERTETYQLPDGTWVNVPSLWMSPTGPVDFAGDEESIIKNLQDFEKAGGQKFKRFGTVDDAVKAAKERSEKGGAGAGPRSDYVDPMVQNASANMTLEDFDVESLIQEASLEGMDVSTLEGDVREVAQAIDIGEAGGDYGALLGFTNRPGRKFDDVNITEMTINELLEFADPGGQYGSYSKRQVGRVATPMGRYQIVGSTLRNLKNKLGLTGEEQFTPEMQDKLFLALLKGRGYDKYKSGEMTKKQFLASVSKEWEGLSKSKKSFNALMAAL